MLKKQLLGTWNETWNSTGKNEKSKNVLEIPDLGSVWDLARRLSCSV